MVQPLNQRLERADRETTAALGKPFSPGMAELSPAGWDMVTTIRIGSPMGFPGMAPRRAVHDVVRDERLRDPSRRHDGTMSTRSRIVASRMFGPNNHASTVAAAARALIDSHAARAAPRPSRGSTPATAQTPMGS